MIVIKSIIQTLSNDDQQKFILYLGQKNKRKDTKNIKLFKLLTKDNIESKIICKQLYNCDNCNAYHALRKRLLQSLIEFTANKSLENENSIDIQIIKYILASRSFLLQKKYDIAYKILDKAEQLADEHLLYPILNEIYHTKIQYAPNYQKVVLTDLILKQNLNNKKHQLEDRLNIVYSKLKSALNTIDENHKSINFEAILKQTLKDSEITLNESLTFKSLYQILSIANISAFVTTSYFEIENFVLKSYDILKSKKETNKQLYYQIHTVYIIANTLFRNKKFEVSLKYLSEMEELMLLNKSIYFKDFILKNTLVKALNLNFSNRPNEAIDIIESILKKKYNDTEGVLDLNLCLLVFYFQQENYLKAKSILSQFYHTDQWYIEKASIDWVIKKNIAELLLYIELQEEDLFSSRLKSFKRRYTKYLKQNNQDQVLTFLDFSEKYHKDQKKIKGQEFKEQINTAFEWRKIHNEDVFVLSAYAWLKSKLDNTNLHRTSIALINM